MFWSVERRACRSRCDQFMTSHLSRHVAALISAFLSVKLRHLVSILYICVSTTTSPILEHLLLFWVTDQLFPWNCLHHRYSGGREVNWACNSALLPWEFDLCDSFDFIDLGPVITVLYFDLLSWCDVTIALLGKDLRMAALPECRISVFHSWVVCWVFVLDIPIDLPYSGCLKATYIGFSVSHIFYHSTLLGQNPSKFPWKFPKSYPVLTFKLRPCLQF